MPLLGLGPPTLALLSPDLSLMHQSGDNQTGSVQCNRLIANYGKKTSQMEVALVHRMKVDWTEELDPTIECLRAFKIL